MAIDHGFKYVKQDGSFWSLEGIAAIDPASTYRFMLSDDSAHQLEPQVGDVAVGDSYATIIPRPLYVAAPALMGGERIIARNGKPFHWPESEEA